jgi:hypothetical protein
MSRRRWEACDGLELLDGKLSRAVLRGLGGSNALPATRVARSLVGRVSMTAEQLAADRCHSGEAMNASLSAMCHQVLHLVVGAGGQDRGRSSARRHFPTSARLL